MLMMKKSLFGGKNMIKLISTDNINNIRIKLKVDLEKLRQNYIPGAVVVPKGIEIKNLTTVNMLVTAEDIRFFTLGLHICDTIERIIDGEYDTKTILYLLDAENDLAYYLERSFKSQQPAPGVEMPDYYFLKTALLMCAFIRDNLEIKVKAIK